MTYRHLPVPELDDIPRYLDQELTSIENTVDNIESYIQLVEAVDQEYALLRGSITLSTDTLTNYADLYIPAPSNITAIPQLITANATAGTITIGRNGVYQIIGYVAQSVGNNSASYVWAIDVDGTQLAIGATVWSNQAGGYAYSATLETDLTAGQVLTMKTIDELTGITVSQSNMSVKMTRAG